MHNVTIYFIEISTSYQYFFNNKLIKMFTKDYDIEQFKYEICKSSEVL